MEITHKTRRPKHLKRHALPLIVIVVALLLMPAVVFSAYVKSRTDSVLVFRGLVTRVRFNPTARELGKAAATNHQAEVNTTVGVEEGMPQAGRSADLDFSLR